jgi:hypothetical protein
MTYDFNKFYIIDLTNNKINDLILKEKNIPLDSYINGVVDNKLYLFDKENLLQYEIDPKKKTSKVVGSTSLNGKYYNSKWEEKDIYEFKNKELIFDLETNILKQIIEGTDFKYIYKDKKL